MNSRMKAPFTRATRGVKHVRKSTGFSERVRKGRLQGKCPAAPGECPPGATVAKHRLFRTCAQGAFARQTPGGTRWMSPGRSSRKGPAFPNACAGGVCKANARRHPEDVPRGATAAKHRPFQTRARTRTKTHHTQLSKGLAGPTAPPDRARPRGWAPRRFARRRRKPARWCPTPTVPPIAPALGGGVGRDPAAPEARPGGSVSEVRRRLEKRGFWRWYCNGNIYWA